MADVTRQTDSGSRTGGGEGAARLRGQRARPAILRLVVFLVAIAAWQLLATIDVLNADYVSKPSEIVAAIGRLVDDPEAISATRETVITVGSAFVVGTSAGILAGIVIGLQSLLREAYLPVVMLLLGTPKSVLLPVLAALFGLGGGSALAFGVLLCFVHVTVNVIGGVDMIESRHLRVASAYGSTPFMRFVHVILPAASPGIFTALWHGLRNAFLGVLIGQLFGASTGIGKLVRTYTNNFQAAEALAVVLVMSFAVIVVGMAWNRLEVSLTRWRVNEVGL